jgi:Integrase core domain/GAG-pre-integrase domain
MTGEYEHLSDVCKLAPSFVELPNGTQTVAEHEGSVRLSGGIVLKRVLYVPSLNCSLISLGKLIKDNDCFVTFTNESCIVQDCTSRTLIGVGEHKNGIYYYHPVASALVNHAKKNEDHVLWHRRMGHPSSVITSLISGVPSGTGDSKEVCEICLKAKQIRDAFSISLNKAEKPFDLIHCDLWGPYRTTSHSGAHYFLTIVDDFTRTVWVYLMAEKGETSTLLKSFSKMIQTQFQKSIKCIRSDNGTEFTSRIMKQFLVENGIVHQTSCVGTPQQNGRVERKHRHILNVARALRFQSNLPISFWGECVLTAAYLINRTPTPLLQNRIPYVMLLGKSPSYTHIKCFGCLCYVKLPTTDKFGSRSRKCVFMGYPFGKKGWRVMDLETHEFIVSRDVVFQEKDFPFVEKVNGEQMHCHSDKRNYTDLSTVTEPIVVGDDHMDSLEVRGSNFAGDEESDDSILELGAQENSQEIDATIMSQPVTSALMPRARQPPAKLRDYICYTAHVNPFYAHPTSSQSSGTPYPISHYVTCNKFSLAHRKFLCAVTKGKEPEHFGEAVKNKNWRDAMKAKIEALERNGTWNVEDLPQGKTLIGCK